VREHKDQFGVEPVLREIGIKSSTFHDWRTREARPSARTVRDEQLAARIREIHKESNGVYGSPRVHAMLRREGERVSRKRVERLMRQEGIAGVCPARKVRTTVRNPADALSHDLVKRDFTASAPNRLWVTDLTLIDTGEGALWLSSIRDAFSRRIVAWHTSPRAGAELVCTALEYALASRDYEEGQLIHHADHGSQYTSIKLTTRLLKAGIRASMGTVGDSYDNALAENFWSVLKTECVRRTAFATRADAEIALFEYIDGFYNTRRIQKNLGWRSPDEYEAAWHAEHQDQPVRRGQPPAPPADRSRGPARDHPAPPNRPGHTANQVSPNRRTASAPETHPNR
jgi:transposase InsO family protein